MAYTAELIIKDGDKVVAKAELEAGESKKGTFITLAPKEGNKSLPFGKLYFDAKAKTAK